MKEFKTLGPTQFGIGNGSQTRFGVARQGDVISSAHVESVITVGWQGEQLLSPTPRTNLLLASNDFASLVWRGSPSLYDDFSLGPPLDPRITFSRPGTSTYIEDGVLKTAAPNEPVFEDGAWRLRPQETNLALWSEDFSKSEWFKSPGVSVAPTSIVNPEGASGAFKLTAAGPSSITIFQSMSVTEGNKYTSFVFARAAEYKYLVVYSFGLGNPFSIVDLETGVATVTGSGHTVETVKLGGGWWCVFVTRTATSASQGERVQFGASKSGSALEHDYDGTSGIYVWAAGFNAGGPIPYIPTTTSQVTAPADSAVIQGSAFSEVFNPSEGAVVFSLGSNIPSGLLALCQVRLDGSSYRGLRVFLQENNARFFMSDATNDVYVDAPLAHRDGAKIAAAWRDGVMKVFANGVSSSEAAYNAPGMIFSPTLYVGHDANIPRKPTLFSSLSIFTRRPSDAEMEALTSA